MSSTHEHNYALQQVRYFTAEDLEANRKGQFSQAQLEQFKASRDFIQQTSGKYENKGWLISLIFGAGLLFFAVVLYFLGVVDMFQSMLGSLFLPAMAGLCLFALLFVFVIAPRSYQSSVDMYKSMGTPMEQKPLGAIHTNEARARALCSASVTIARRAGPQHAQRFHPCLVCAGNGQHQIPHHRIADETHRRQTSLPCVLRQ